MNSLFKSKKSQGAGWSWVYGLSFLFALGILYTIFLYVFDANLVPTIKEVTNTTISDDATRMVVYNGNDKYMTYFKLLPFILFFIVIIYMVVTTIYKQSGGQVYWGES